MPIKLHTEIFPKQQQLLFDTLSEQAISGRGSKRDFIDLFFLLKHFSISWLLLKYPKKYGIEISNHYHLLKSLVYFEGAENQPMPTMLQNVSWGDGLRA